MTLLMLKDGIATVNTYGIDEDMYKWLSAQREARVSVLIPEEQFDHVTSVGEHAFDGSLVIDNG